MRSLDLREIPAVYMNLEQHNEKNENMQKILKECGFKTIIRVEGVSRPDRPVAGCSAAHNKGLMEIDPPFVLFEDDCMIKNFRPEIEVPDDADALFIGVSQWARYLNFSGPFLHYRKVDDKVVQVYNMLSGHAVIYLTEEYRQVCSRISKYCGYQLLDHMDNGYAEIQKYYNVYSLDMPIFKQNGHNG